MLQWLRHALTSPSFWVAAVAGGWMLLLFVVALWERRDTCPYVLARRPARPPVPPGAGAPVLDYHDDTPDPSELSEYVLMREAALRARGFEYGAMLSAAPKWQVRVLGSVWLSPARDVLAVCGSGRVLRMDAYQTWLFTPLNNGRLLVTTDNNDAGHYAGLYLLKRRLNVSIDDLLEFHAARMTDYAGQITPFAEPAATDALFAIYQRQAESLVRRRLARYVDPERVWWRHTGLGALLVALGFWVQLAKSIPQFYRVNRSPVGSPKLRTPATGGTTPLRVH